MERVSFRGLDTLRVFSLTLITWQHVASVLGFDAQTQWHRITPGQTGVAIFCAISGLLAFASQPPDLGLWIKKRLLRIFPAYWIVTIFAFLLVLIWPSKPVTIGLFVSQMLGLGFFTHGWALVNIVSWFVSLILLCYALSVFGWYSRFPKAFWWAVSIVAVWLVVSRTEVDLSRHVLAFGLGALVALGGMRYLLWILSAGLIAFGVVANPQFFYSGFAFLLILISAYGLIKDPRLVQVCSAYGYEYFLIHGICLVGAYRFFPNPIPGLAIAGIAAIFGSYILQGITKRLDFYQREKSLSNHSG